MDQRKRMLFALVCLTGAMTSTASLLAWMAPSLPTTLPETLATNMLGIARSLVTEDVAVQRAQWQRVEIVPEPAAVSSGMILTSATDSGAYHFFIDDRGTLTRASNWRGQIPAGRDTNTVRVRLARSASDETISQRQSRALSALLRALDELVSPARESLPVRLDPTFTPAALRATAIFPDNRMLSRISG